MNNYELHMKMHTCHDDCQNPICIAVRKAVEEEREACAKVCEQNASFGNIDERYASRNCAETIRARGQK